MNKLYVIWVLFFLCSCGNNNRNVDGMSKGSNISLTGKDSSIIDMLEQRYTMLTRALPQEEPNVTLASLKQCKLEVCPYYDFDVQGFYSNPSPQGILDNLKTLKDRICWVGERQDGTDFLLFAQKSDGTWKMERLVEGWKELVVWLPNKLQEAGVNEYKMFSCYASYFFLFYRESQPIFCDIQGNEYTPNKMCEIMMGM